MAWQSLAFSASLIFPLGLACSRLKSAPNSGISASVASLYKLINVSIKCKAVGESSKLTVIGHSNNQTFERSGLVNPASAFVIDASDAFLPNDSLLGELIRKNLDLLYTLGAGGLGLSLFFIHVYVTEIKRSLQALWAFGVIRSFLTYTTLAQPAGENLIQFVVDNPTTVWFVGPLFAALTGLVFKEGLCYGKLEADVLTFIIPAVLLEHLTGLMDNGVKPALFGSWMALFVIFAGRKLTQPIKDDVGDKSVFMFNSLPEDEKKALIEKLEQQKFGQDVN